MSIKQSAKHTTQETSGNRIPKCWEHGTGHPCLRIETASGDSLILPYQQFVSAHYRRTDDCEVVELAFLSHDVRLTGRGLIGLVNALQKFAVEWIAPLLVRYRNLIDKTDPAIDGIEIKPVEKSVLPV